MGCYVCVVHKQHGFLPSEQLIASQDGKCALKLVRVNVTSD
jgi:hypothetical protein